MADDTIEIAGGARVTPGTVVIGDQSPTQAWVTFRRVVFHRARTMASRQGRKVSELVDQAVAEYLARQDAAPAKGDK